MKLSLAIEWFLNPDHLPFIVAFREGIFERYGIDFELIEPDEHYDGLDEVLNGTIEFATNEPLHLIEQYNENFLSLGMFFETQGGVLLKASSYEKLLNGENIIVTTPVSNDTTNAIGFEIIRRFYAQKEVIVTREQVAFIPNGFEHLKYMKEGADAGWLYFYNFEGVEAQHEGMEVLYLDAANAGFANFSALDIFVNKTFYTTNTKICENFTTSVREAIRFIHEFPLESMDHYYSYTGEAESLLMDDILRATMTCFNPDFDSSYAKELPILDFFTEIGITSLDSKQFKTAFLA
ncbi:MAG: ABC transporter substrate-binding protein [Sulfurimonas sp.]|jgi:ABC-type nitrate/sulfonate/bicarbonate transport system substrate-binding protein